MFGVILIFLHKTRLLRFSLLSLRISNAIAATTITTKHSAAFPLLVKLSAQLSCSTVVCPSANSLIDGNNVFN